MPSATRPARPYCNPSTLGAEARLALFADKVREFLRAASASDVLSARDLELVRRSWTADAHAKTTAEVIIVERRIRRR